MVDCDIYNISSEAFKGLETYLHTLDVSNNNITEFPIRMLQQHFNMLMKLGLRDNNIKHLFSIHNEKTDKVSNLNEKKKSKDKTTVFEENKRISQETVNNHHEFYSLQDFDFSGWNNGPLQINILNGYVQIMLNCIVILS